MTDRDAPRQAGEVRGRITVPVGPAVLWRTLCEPRHLRGWLADCDRPLSTAGTRVDLQLGGGDFFTAEVGAVDPDRCLTFRWRHLGAGPESTVTLTLRPVPAGTELTLSDHRVDRPPSETAQLRSGWEDLLNRLGRYQVTGRSARSTWRPVIDPVLALPVQGWSPLTAGTIADWMPIATERSVPAWFFVIDDDGPRRFAVHRWQLEPDRLLQFVVAIPGAERVTTAQVRLAPEPGSRQLALRHDGWDRLGLSDYRSRGLHHRFAAAWSAAFGLAAAEAGLRTDGRPG